MDYRCSSMRCAASGTIGPRAASPRLEISEQDFDIEGGDPALPVVNRHLDDHLDTIYRELPEANRAIARYILPCSRVG